MKIKPLIRAIQVAADLAIIGSAAKSIYDKFKSSKNEDDTDSDEDDDEYLLDETDEDDEGEDAED